MRARVIEDEEEDNIFSVRRIDDDSYTDSETAYNKNSGGGGSKFNVVTATDDNRYES